MNTIYPRISIVIPVYNRQEFFARSLQSALAQKYPNTEIIVVDDGSEPAITIPKNISNNVILVRQKHAGAPAARNRGFSKSTGEYVIFWDADLLAEPTMLMTMATALQNNPTASYAYCDYMFGYKKMKARAFNASDLRIRNYITTTSLIRSKDFCGFDENLKKFQDWDLWLTLLEKNKTGIYVPDNLFKVATGGTMSAWLPRFAYHAPWKWLPGIRARVMQYEQAWKVIAQKHGLPQ